MTTHDVCVFIAGACVGACIVNIIFACKLAGITGGLDRGSNNRNRKEPGPGSTLRW
jgi:hypothetical protein